MVRQVSGIALLVAALAGAGCGGDDDNGDHEHPMPVPDGGYPEVPCPADTPEFHIGLEATGDDALVKARLVDAVPAPPGRNFNDWTVDFQNPDGSALDDVELTHARSFMPVHGHDGIYDPVITQLDEPGRFQVDRLNLWMYGPWLVELWVSSESAGGMDHIVFHVCNNRQQM